MIDTKQATHFCGNLITLLAGWPALKAALQSGGVEVKASSLIAVALEDLAVSKNLLVLREYKQIDFALIVPATVGEPQLTVKTVIEVKFNYAQQLGEIRARLPDAVDQADRYRRMVRAQSAYVLYLVAAPFLERMPLHPRDSGWRYWQSPQNGKSAMEEAVKVVETSAQEVNAPIRGQQSHEHERHHLYCALLECSG